jgi:hypothetical protein
MDCSLSPGFLCKFNTSSLWCQSAQFTNCCSQGFFTLMQSMGSNQSLLLVQDKVCWAQLIKLYLPV